MIELSTEQPKGQLLLNQLIGEWTIGIALKTPDGKIVSGCGDMTAAQIPNIGVNSEIDTRIEGYEDYFENDLWSHDEATGKVHVFCITSKGDTRDRVGVWKDVR